MVRDRTAVTLPGVTEPQLPSGWFPDPLGRYDHRWFNGSSWTSDVSVDGQRFVDPLGVSPGGAGGPASAGNRAATAAMICGLVGVSVAWAPFIVVAGIVLGVIALVAGIRGLRRSRSIGRGRGAAITGIVTGGAALALSILGVVLSIAVIREVLDFIEPGPRFVEVRSCVADGRDVLVDGTITNLSDERRDYTVFAEVDGRTAFAAVEFVDPDEVVRWEVSLRTPEALGSCDPDDVEVIVNGPFPFGVETDPVRDGGR